VERLQVELLGGASAALAARSEAASKFGRLGENLDLQEGKEWLSGIHSNERFSI
jgi:hypothetical protein